MIFWGGYLVAIAFALLLLAWGISAFVAGYTGSPTAGILVALGAIAFPIVVFWIAING